MPGLFFKFWNRRLSTFGNLAFAAFLIAALSGIPLSFFYSVERAADSLQLLMLTSTAGDYFRSIHYWSGQIFMFCTLFHIIEHLWKGSERELKPGLWLRLVLVLLFSFFVMLSGFILKADVEGRMARQILSGLLETLPIIGRDLRLMVLGSSESLALIYIHHLVTTSLIIAIVIIEHVRRAWPELLAYIYLLGTSSILAVLLPQGLQMSSSASIRGPWYFIGLQETLHWVTEPLAVVLIVSGCLIGLIMLRWMKPGSSRWTKQMLLGLLVFYTVLTINNWGFRDANWNSLFF